MMSNTLVPLIVLLLQVSFHSFVENCLEIIVRPKKKTEKKNSFFGERSPPELSN